MDAQEDGREEHEEQKEAPPAPASAPAPSYPAFTITDDDSIQTILNALKLFSGDIAVVSQAFDYLSKYGTSGENQTSWLRRHIGRYDMRSTFQQIGGIPVVLAAMQKHPSLEEKAHRALLDLLPIRTTDGVQSIVDTMNKVSTAHVLGTFWCLSILP
jgi:hypothetical protein